MDETVEELTVDQQKAIALGKARLRLQQTVKEEKPKEDQGLLFKPESTEFAATGALGAFTQGLKSSGTGIANVVGAISDEELKEDIIKTQQASALHPFATGAGKVAGSIAGFAGLTLAGTAMAGLAPITLAPLALGLIGTIPAVAAYSAGNMQERSHTYQLAGVPEDDAKRTAFLQAAIEAPLMALPGGIGTTTARGVISGIGLNLAGGVVSRAVGNTQLPEFAQQKVLDPTHMTIEAGLGAVAGSLGRYPAAAFTSPIVNPSGAAASRNLGILDLASRRIEEAKAHATKLGGAIVQYNEQLKKTPNDISIQHKITAIQEMVDDDIRVILSMEELLRKQGQQVTSIVDDAAKNRIMQKDRTPSWDQGDPTSITKVVETPITARPRSSLSMDDYIDIDHPNFVSKKVPQTEEVPPAKVTTVVKESNTEAEAQVTTHLTTEDNVNLKAYTEIQNELLNPVDEAMHTVKEVTPEKIAKSALAQSEDGLVTREQVNAVVTNTVYTRENMAKWENIDFITSLFDKKIEKFLGYKRFAKSLRTAMSNDEEAARAASFESLSNYILHEAIYPIKGELLRRRKALIDNWDKLIPEEQLRRQGLIDKIDASLGKQEGMRMESVSQTETKAFIRDDLTLRRFVQQNDLPGALKYISDTYPKTTFGIVAEWLNNNPRIKPWISDQYPTNPDARGQYLMEKGEFGQIRFSREGEKSPDIFVHEVVHAALARQLELAMSWRKGMLTDSRLLREWNSMPKEQQMANLAVIQLYQDVLHRIGKGEPGSMRSHTMKNVHEFAAYGLSNPSFVAKLLDEQGTGGFALTNAMKQLWHYITVMLGFNKTDKIGSAFAELMIHGNTLIKYSSGEGMSLLEQALVGRHNAPMYATKIKNNLQHSPTIDPPQPPAALRATLASFPNDVDIPSNWFSRAWYGPQQFIQMVQSHPILHNTASVLRFADDKATHFYNYVMHGDQANLVRKHFGPLVSLSKMDAGDSIALLSKKLPLSDWEAVMPIIQYAGNNRVEHSDALKLMGGQLTPNQKKLHSALATYADRVRDFQNIHIMNSPFGYSRQNPAIAYHAGWFPSVRKGDYDVLVHYNDIVLYSERVRTKAEAVALLKRMQQDPSLRGAGIKMEDISALKAEQITMKDLHKKQLEMADRLEALGHIQTAADLRTVVQQDMARGGPLGGHAMRRHEIPGSEGRKMYHNKIDQVREFRQSYLDYADEGKSLITKKLIQDNLESILNDQDLIRRFPNAIETSRHLADMATNNFMPWTAKIDRGVRTFFDNVAVEAVHMAGFKDWYPKTHVFDRTAGILSHLFYMATLTSRPGFWIAQALTSTSALRMMFRTDNTMDALLNMGKGMATVFSGGDKEFHKALNYVASNLNTLHPQLINELNSIGFKFGEKAGTAKYVQALQSIIPWATGEKVGGAADAVSRYISFAMFYQQRKSQGLRGVELYRAAAADTDSTMVQYANPYRPPVIRKMGIIGDMVAPLQTFATAQLGNLTADIKYLINNKTMKSSLPLIATALTTMLMGGAIGLPFIVEYEALRQILIWADPKYKDMPSVIDTMNQEEQMEAGKELGLPRGSLTYGLPSAVMGYDVGSGLRWNAIISKALTGEEHVMSIFPAVEFGRSVASNIITGLKYSFSDQLVRDAEYRKAIMGLSSFIVGGKYLQDKYSFEASTRDFVPGGNRGYAMRPQIGDDESKFSLALGGKEQVSTLIGSGTLRAKQDQAVDRVLRQDERLRSEQRQKAIDVLIDSVTIGDINRTERAIQTLGDLELTNDQINSQLETAFGNRNISQRDRFFVTGKGKITRQGQQRFQRQERFGEYSR